METNHELRNHLSTNENSEYAQINNFDTFPIIYRVNVQLPDISTLQNCLDLVPQISPFRKTSRKVCYELVISWRRTMMRILFCNLTLKSDHDVPLYFK